VQDLKLKRKKICSLKLRFLGPLIFGDYPDTMKRTIGSRLPVFSEEESEQVKGSSDFIGINH
jgi:beta-glucosidase